MTVLKYTHARITLRDATGEWTYVSGPWRQHMTTQTRERLRREVADWVKRAQHEAKLAFAEGDLWSALAWGAKVPELLAVEKDARAQGYETGMAIDVLYERVARIVRELDSAGRIKDMFGSRAMDLIVGIDMGKGSSATAIMTLFQKELDRMTKASQTFVDRCIIRAAGPEELDELARERPVTDDELRERCRKRLNGIAADSVIIDDPYKE